MLSTEVRIEERFFERAERTILAVLIWYHLRLKVEGVGGYSDQVRAQVNK